MVLGFSKSQFTSDGMFCTSVEFKAFLLIFFYYHYSLLMCELQERKTEVTQSNVLEAMREKGKVPMLRDREEMPS